MNFYQQIFAFFAAEHQSEGVLTQKSEDASEPQPLDVALLQHVGGAGTNGPVGGW